MFSSGKKRISHKSKFRKIMRKKPDMAYKLVVLLLLAIYILLFKQLMILENQPENANAVTAIYWATTTIATVGYGDVVFTSLPGRLFSIVVQVTGIILISGFLATYVIAPWMDKVIKFRMPRKVPSSMKDHIIICGYNQLVETLIDELAAIPVLTENTCN